LWELTLKEKKAEIKQFVQDIGQSSSEGVVIYDHSHIITADDTFAAMFGYTTSELTNKNITDLIYKKDAGGTSLSNHLKETSQHRGIRKDGTTFYIEIFEHPYHDQGHIVQAAVVRDISERVENEKRIEYMAYYDELTDLPNRNFFHHVLKGALEE